MTKSSTLRLRFPFGQTLLLAFLILVLLSALLEVAARQFLDDYPTAIGSANLDLDVKIYALDQLVAEKGRVDCIFFGSSVVLNGIDPDRFALTYREQTGEDLICYNFGMLALTARTAGVLSEILIERYHPRLLVYGLTIRDLAAGASDANRIYQDVTRTPWIRYQRGEFDVEGWLADHSHAYRHYLAYRSWISPTFASRLSDFTDAPPSGYVPFHATRALDWNQIEAPLYFEHFEIDPADWQGFEQLLATAGTQLVLLEMPLPSQLLAKFSGGAEAYAASIDSFAAAAAAKQVPLWTTTHLNLIPDEDWAEDAHHLNNAGAQIFSAWLAEYLAQAVEHGQLRF
ncbi:MAG TPA: hypothetical protein VHP83_23530 [Aggregatilineaceae bacterium]|nr:hypothetical protein [Aggregatilineaceae bacterium]